MAQYPVPTLAEMLEQGRRKLTEKAPEMKENYVAAIPTAVDNYDKLPFGGKMSRNYRSRMQKDAGNNYKVNPEGWAKNFEQAATAN